MVAALLWAGGAAGQEAGDSIRGRVLDARTRTAVPGAVVTLTRGEVRDTVGRALTGDDGRFGFAVAARGVYRLRVEAFGYTADASRTLDYQGGALSVDVSVLPSPLAAGGIEVVVTRPAVVEDQTQVISGVILDAESEDPLADLAVSLRTVRDELLGWTTSDADGHFVFAVAEPGLYRLGFTAMGYDSTATVRVAVARGQDVYVELRAEPTPFGLGEIRVTAPHDLPRLEAAGFYRRRELGRGDFYGPRELDRLPGVLTSQLLRQLEDVTVVPWGMWVRGTFGPMGMPCRPTIVLDGMELRDIETRGRTLSQIVPERTIRAIELYKHIHEIPQEWRGDRTCAVMAIWTDE